MDSFRGAQKLISYLVRMKFYPLEGKIRSCGYGKRCQICLYVNEANLFNYPSTNKIQD